MAPSKHVPEEIYLPAPPSHPSSTDSTSKPTPDVYHIIFITGNPGLIGYYQTYLAHLYSLLNNNAQPSSPRFSIYGRSLRGFEINASSHHSSLASRFKHGPWGLPSQIEFTDALVQSYVTKLAKPATSSSGVKQRAKVILVGHSLGTYLILEVLRRRNERLRSLRKGEWNADAQFDIVAGVLLFPTVTELALSPNGRKFSWLLRAKWVVAVLVFFANLLVGFVGLLGMPAIAAVVQWWTGMTETAARVTGAWLMTKGGIRQALHLARDELREMTGDKWDEEIWGSVGGQSVVNGRSGMMGGQTTRTKLFFYYGEQDHWIANTTRDTLIAARGRMEVKDEGKGVEMKGDGEDGRPVMEIDRNGITHDFCIRHSEPVARRTARYIQDTIHT